VAHLFAVVQQPRSDDEPSDPAFDAAVGAEVVALQERVDAWTRDGVASSHNGFGGVVEAETTRAVIRLIAAAEAAGMPQAAELLRAALGRCKPIPQQRLQEPKAPVFPEPERIIDPKTGKPIGLWR
jgi:hypothetical protein